MDSYAFNSFENRPLHTAFSIPYIPPFLVILLAIKKRRSKSRNTTGTRASLPPQQARDQWIADASYGTYIVLI